MFKKTDSKELFLATVSILGQPPSAISLLTTLNSGYIQESIIQHITTLPDHAISNLQKSHPINLANSFNGGNSIIFANCNTTRATRGDKSIPPKSGITLRHIFNKGSVKLCKRELAEL